MVETPSFAIGKQRSTRANNTTMMMTPGSGDALLRGQVKTLLQKVEEEVELPKVSLDSRPPFIHLQGCACVNSPMGLLAPAPTPANTPQLSNLSEDGSINNSGLGSTVMALPVVEGKLKISEDMSLESQKSLITRSLLQHFSEKSEYSEICYDVTDQGVIIGESSVRVKASAHDEEKEAETFEEMGADDYKEVAAEEEEGDDDKGGLVNELCNGFSKISMNEMFLQGNHTRFVCNSDDEIEGEEKECAENSADILRLKGLPTPKGKHLHFPLEEQEDE